MIEHDWTWVSMIPWARNHGNMCIHGDNFTIVMHGEIMGLFPDVHAVQYSFPPIKSQYMPPIRPQNHQNEYVNPMLTMLSWRRFGTKGTLCGETSRGDLHCRLGSLGPSQPSLGRYLLMLRSHPLWQGVLGWNRSEPPVMVGETRAGSWVAQDTG